MIELQEVHSGYSELPVLKGITLTVEEGDFCALLGPNGAGKSTLLYTIMGYLKPHAGSIKLFGREFGALKRSYLARQLAFVPQENVNEFDHTVHETVLMGRYPYLGLLQSFSSKDRDVVSAILQQLGLIHLKNRWLSELSGGEKQRVLIARALAQQTPCLILDESLSQLDINHQIEIMRLLQEIHVKQKKTVLIVSHNLNLAANYAQKLIFVKDGTLLAYGEPDKLMHPNTLQGLFGLPLETVTNPHSGRPNIVYP